MGKPKWRIIYFVCNNGNITHCNSSGQQKQESEIELPITDIWGVEDFETGEPIVLYTATEEFTAPVIIKYLTLILITPYQKLHGLDTKENLTIAVGENNQSAFIIKLKKK